jgi:hypothetical protein
LGKSLISLIYNPKGDDYMRAFSRLFSNVFTDRTTKNESVRRQWDQMRAKALGPSDLAEIDAIFSRQL